MSTTALKVTIFGAGSIGCYLGGQLADSGAQVTFVGRERFRTQLAENGLTLTHYAREPVHVPSDGIQFNTDTREIHDADVVLVTVKSQDTAGAGLDLNHTVNRDALIISFQNGVGNADRLREVMPGFTVLGAMVPFNVTSTGPGEFHCGTEGDLCIEFNPSDKLMLLQSCFTQIGQGCLLSDDIAAVQWGKLLVNLNNALNALTGSTLYAGLVQRDYRRALALMIEEALHVVQTAGIKPEKFGKASPEKMLKILRLPNIL
ncbi:MAG: 2-dehydropantoate 2-reductase, partial [Gammaproteobacteria bacterium]|nr:2-dehydropantoate 2-reductase [Gammaproteobacteria bacterium]